MKAISLLLLRISTGLLLIIWGHLRTQNPKSGIGLSEKYYNGLLNQEGLQAILGYAEIALGAFIILGLLRIIVYPVQALVLGAGAFFIWKHILNPIVSPFGVQLFEEGQRGNLLFFPSLTVFFATLILLAFREYDAIAVDRVFRR